jgi:hypothetical protein
VTIYTNPVREEAVILTTTHLVRWDLNDLSVPLAQVEHGRGWRPPLAVAADGDTFALPAPERHGPYEERVIEIRRWDDFRLVNHFQIPDSAVGLTAFAYSPDGRWLATADMYENVYLLHAVTGALGGVDHGGEFTSALSFSPNGKHLGALCTFQGGGFVGVWRVDGHGLRKPVIKMDRSSLRWRIHVDGSDGQMDFADTFGTLAFSPDTHLLAACAKSDWCPWHGEIAVYEVATGRPVWRTPLQARTGGGRLGSKILFAADGSGVVYGSATGEITILGVVDGSPRRSVTARPGTDTSTLAADRQHRGVWAIGPDERPHLITL